MVELPALLPPKSCSEMVVDSLSESKWSMGKLPSSYIPASIPGTESGNEEEVEVEVVEVEAEFKAKSK